LSHAVWTRLERPRKELGRGQKCGSRESSDAAVYNDPIGWSSRAGPTRISSPRLLDFDAWVGIIQAPSIGQDALFCRLTRVTAIRWTRLHADERDVYTRKRILTRKTTVIADSKMTLKIATLQYPEISSIENLSFGLRTPACRGHRPSRRSARIFNSQKKTRTKQTSNAHQRCSHTQRAPPLGLANA
jgi:hypothetical protein